MNRSRLAQLLVHVCLGIVLLIAAAVRLVGLHELPAFIDESGHIVSAMDYSFFPLIDRLRFGKVLGYVVFYPTARFFDDPLVATRRLVASIGVLTTLGLFVWVRGLAGSAAGLVAATLWAGMPYVVFHDRLALHDPLASCLVIWSLVLLSVAVKRRLHAVAVVGGAVMGLAALTKVTTVLAMFWGLLVVAFCHTELPRRRRVTLSVSYGLAVAIVTGAIAAAMLFDGLPPESRFLIAESSSLGTRFLGPAYSWYWDYNGVGAIYLCLLAIASALAGSRLQVILWMCALLGVIAHVAILNTWPRYLLFVLLPVVASCGVLVATWGSKVVASVSRRFKRPEDRVEIARLILLTAVLIVLVRQWTIFGLDVIHDPARVHMPPIDRYQYVDGWPSSEGLDRVVAALNEETRVRGSAVVYVGGFGRHGWWTLPRVPSLSTVVEVQNRPIQSAQVLREIAASAIGRPTYILLEPPIYDLTPEQSAQIVPPLVPVLRYRRARTDAGYLLYRVQPGTRVMDDPAGAAKLAAGEPVVTAVHAPNRLETYEGRPFFWIGTEPVSVDVEGRSAVMVEFEATFFLGPSATGPTRRLHVSLNGEPVLTKLVGNETASFSLRLPAGPSHVTLACSDEVVTHIHPNGDTRVLLLGVKALTLRSAAAVAGDR